jgi:putative aldouronate transport system permease protein
MGVNKMEVTKKRKQNVINDKGPKITWREIKKQKELILLSIPFVIYALVFYYAPLGGWIMAFQNYKPKGGLLHSQFVGLAKFKTLFSNDVFIRVIRNTLCMGVINLVLSFVFSIGLAILLNEVRNKRGKKFVQTVSYLPHFLSWIIVTGIVLDVLSLETGIINQALVALHILDKPINWLAYPKFFWLIVGFANVWKETGWGSIIYLASITSINPDLYEAASIDGAGRLQKIFHITLPGIKPTIFILLLINVGNVLNAGFEVQYLLGNGLVQSVSQTIDIYVLKYGISMGDYSIGTAAGIFKSLVSIIIIFLANKAAKMAGEERLF